MNYQGLRNILSDIEAEKKARQKQELKEQLEAELERQHRANIEEERQRLHVELERGVDWEPQPEARGAIPVQLSAADKSDVNSKTGPKDDGTRKKPRKDVFNRRLEALKAWLISYKYTLGRDIITLPKHYTLELVYTELGVFTEQSEYYKGLFVTIELNSFDSHFWGKQKIVELMRGNKTAIL